MQVRCAGCFGLFDDQFRICPHCGHFHGAPQKELFELEIGTVLKDRYVIGKEVGLGGFGITYKAWDQTLETIVAIKEYYPGSMVTREPGKQEVICFENKKRAFQFGLDRLITEAQYMAQFNTHDNIVHVLAYFEANNTAYIVMEFLDGCTLSEYVQQNGLRSWEGSVDIILQVCEALSDIHKVSIIHRDISPDNIFMCDNGKVKLIDFGAARFAKNMESNYTVILKPGFAPPEQYTNISKQGPWTDVYAVGATLYYLVTGQRPEESTNRKMSDTLAEPIAINPYVPQYVSDAIMKAMAIDPHLRFATINDFVSVIRKEKPVVSLQTEKKRRRTKRFVGIAALVAAFAIIAGSLLWGLFSKDTLPDASIEMWYVENDAGTMQKSYKKVIESFGEAFPNVKIETQSFSTQAQLREALQTGTPNLVQVDASMAGNVRNTLDLLDVAKPKSKTILEVAASVFDIGGCKFLKHYPEYFPDHSSMPTGFTIPVLFVNTHLVQFDADRINGLADLNAFIEADDVVMLDRRSSTAKDLFEPEENDAVVFGTVEEFVTGKDAAFFLSDTSEYATVISEMTNPDNPTGDPKMVEIRADDLPCEWEVMWSVVERSDAQDAAAKRFLEYLLGDTAQTYLFGNRNGGSLPLNKRSLSRFCDLFDEFSFVPSATKHCVFGEMR